MKILLTIALLSMPLLAWAEPQMEMHRVQASTADPSGWYLAASTHGSFSVLIPITKDRLTIVFEKEWLIPYWPYRVVDLSEARILVHAHGFAALLSEPFV